MSLIAPSISAENLEATTLEIMREWLAGYFDGASHTVSGTARTFPLATLSFQAAALAQPLNGLAITVVWTSSGRERRTWLGGKRRIAREIALQVFVRAGYAASATTTSGVRGNADEQVQAGAGLARALFDDPTARVLLAGKGLGHVRITPPAPLPADTNYATRTMTVTGTITYDLE